MTYIYENELYHNVFEIIDSIYPDLRITTVGSLRDDPMFKLDRDIVEIINRLDDGMFVDTILKKVYTDDEFFKLHNIRFATEQEEAEDEQELYI